MCKIAVDNTLNPNFVLYNLVFGSNPLRYINADSLGACMSAYGMELGNAGIQRRLDEWHGNGMLRIRNGNYVVV